MIFDIFEAFWGHWGALGHAVGTPWEHPGSRSDFGRFWGLFLETLEWLRGAVERR